VLVASLRAQRLALVDSAFSACSVFFVRMQPQQAFAKHRSSLAHTSMRVYGCKFAAMRDALGSAILNTRGQNGGLLRRNMVNRFAVVTRCAFQSVVGVRLIRLSQQGFGFGGR